MDHERFEQLVQDLDAKLTVTMRKLDRYYYQQTDENAEAIADALWQAGKTAKQISLEYGELWNKAREADDKQG